MSITNREKGAAPLSIGTSLALEMLCGFGEHESSDPPGFHYDELWVNLRTLYRNCIGAVATPERVHLNHRQLLDGLVEDIEVLSSTVESTLLGKLKVSFYYCDYSDFKLVFPLAKFRELKTPKQLFENELEKAVYKLFYSGSYTSNGLNFRHFDTRFKDKGKNVILLSSYPLDLLWRKNFNALTLIESHTGVIKPRSVWYTKLTGGSQLVRIPFNSLSLQVFGENLLFASMPPAIKRKILAMAEEDKWTSVTTDERIEASIKKLYDPTEKAFFLRLLRAH
jgi:hypothetical protein